MIDALSLIDVPDDVRTLNATEDGRYFVQTVRQIHEAYPEFFATVANISGMGLPLSEGEMGLKDEGKRVLALELLAILKMSYEPTEKEQ